MTDPDWERIETLGDLIESAGSSVAAEAYSLRFNEPDARSLSNLGNAVERLSVLVDELVDQARHAPPVRLGAPVEEDPAP
jgi:hypothetical protein